MTNLYTAQVKRKCGIIERENYNKPESENANQPQCPEDKEKAIMDALKHFGMVQVTNFIDTIILKFTRNSIDKMNYEDYID